ncbi:hypothetical protein [Rhizobium sp.]
MASAGDLELDIRYWLRLSKLFFPDSNLSASLAEWRAKFTPSQQRAGLKAAFADIAEMSMELSQDRIAALDDLLATEGFKTLTELRLTHGRRIKRLLKAKRIKSEDDLIALKGMMDAGFLSEEEEAHVWRLIDAFKP